MLSRKCLAMRSRAEGWCSEESVHHRDTEPIHRRERRVRRGKRNGTMSKLWVFGLEFVVLGVLANIVALPDQMVRGKASRQRRKPMHWLLANFHWFAGVWALCLVLVILYFAIDAFREWRGNMRKEKSRPWKAALPVVLFVILAWAWFGPGRRPLPGVCSHYVHAAGRRHRHIQRGRPSDKHCGNQHSSRFNRDLCVRSESFRDRGGVLHRDGAVLCK